MSLHYSASRNLLMLYEHPRIMGDISARLLALTTLLSLLPFYHCRYYPPNEKPKSKPSAVQERPLHLYLEGSNQESLEKAKAHILQILDGKGRDEAGKPYTAGTLVCIALWMLL